MNNKVAHLLKTGSIVLFVASLMLEFINLIGIESRFSSSFVDMGMAPTPVNYVASFFSAIIVSAIGCTLLYAFGELIELVAVNNTLIRNSKIVHHTGESQLTKESKKPSAGNQYLLHTSLIANCKKLDQLEKEGKLKELDITITGINSSIHTYYLKIYNAQLAVKEKVEIQFIAIDSHKTSMNIKGVDSE